VKFWADENLRRAIFDAVKAACPEHEFERIQDTEFNGTDPEILEEAARQGIIVITHDENTLVGYAYERLQTCLVMPGVILVKERTSTGEAVDDLILLISTGFAPDFENQVRHIPLNL
jgi:hypothetical protein